MDYHGKIRIRNLFEPLKSVNHIGVRFQKLASESMSFWNDSQFHAYASKVDIPCNLL